MEVPAIRVIDGSRIVDEPDIGVGEGGQAKELGRVSVTAYGRVSGGSRRELERRSHTGMEMQFFGEGVLEM